jgi:MYXO-CTERM domain-containing protein
MLRRLISISGVAIGVSLAAAVVTAGPALAKGATQAMITGPGLARPIIVADAGEPGQSGKLATLAEQSGLFTVLFGASTIGPETIVPSPPPHAALGPRYALVYTVPGVEPQPGERYGRLRQDLYPYATGGPLTYTPPGQHGFTQQLPETGWLRADPALVGTLTQLGLPAPSKPASVRPHPADPPGASATHPPQTSAPPDRSGVPTWPIGIAAGLLAAALAAATLWRHRRKLNAA